MLKFLVKGGTVTIRSSRVIPMECAMISGPSTQHPVTSQVLEEKIKVAIHPEYPEQTIAIGSTLTEKGRKELCALLRQNLDVFAWKPADMTGVPRHMAEHRLNVREGCPPVRQKKRGQAPERNKAIQEEVKKLVDAGIKKEVHYHSWLSNPIMVKKHDGSWRMCVEFKDLNKACRQDGYPLPEIDWKVESLCGYPFKCFLDAYKGYHQIKMAEKDEEKIAFITSQGIFCYTKMSFGLKNVGATYQRLVDRAFQKQIGRNLELNGKLASLNRFLSKSAEKSLPFLKTLKKCTKKSDFQWTQEAEVAFKQMKKLLAELPMLTAPKEKDELIIYLAATKETISAVLMTEKGGNLAQRKQTAEKISGRMLKWKFELEGYDIQYRPRTSIKGQILADFIEERPDEESPDEPMAEPEELPESWTLFTDGSSCIDGSGSGLILANPEGVEFTYAMRFRFEATNNEAEYESLIAGLRIAEQMGVKNLQANVDSRLVANQVHGSYVAKESEREQEGGCPKQDCPEGPGKVKFLIVAIDYFTKWIEAKPVATITGNQVKKFVWDSIVCRFGLPGEIVSDNGKQFRVWEKESKLDWIGELSHVLWAHRIMIKSNNGETPFSLTYCTKAVIPAEIGMPTLQTAEVDLIKNDKALEINLDLIEEKREQAAIQEAKSKAKMEKYYNSKVRSTSFRPGDMVYRSNDTSHAKDGGKLGPKWEGPYEVTESIGKGAYKLKDRNGNELPRTWNICNLKKCYIHEV
ncbi:reverse transcriptase domain-containing protein [Tanacetum coccineum]